MAFTIQTGTLILAAATFFGALVGVLFRWLYRWREKRRKRRNLRLALQAEITELKALETGHATELLGLEEIGSLFPNQVYRANIENIGSLTEAEVSEVVALYSGIDALIDVVQLTAEEPKDLPSEIEEISKIIESLRERRKDALSAIEDNL